MAEAEKTLENYDRYARSLFAPEDAALRETIAAMAREKLPSIAVSPVQGKLLQVLALMIGAKRILEIGTLGGYSGIHLARALPPDGRLISLELDAHHAEVSRANLAQAGLADRAEVRVGPADASLEKMSTDGEAPFDLIFIDADKDGYPRYLELALPLLREGGVLLGDNTLSHGVLDPHADTGITRYNRAVAAHPDLVSAMVPVLKHGIDGLLVSVKRTG